MPETLVLAPVSKELRSGDTQAYSKEKALKTTDQQLFLDQSEKWGCRANHLPSPESANTVNHSQGQSTGSKAVGAVNW